MTQATPREALAISVRLRLQTVIEFRGWKPDDFRRQFAEPPPPSTASTWLALGVSHYPTLARIASVFGCTAGQLAGDEDWPEHEEAMATAIWDPTSENSREFGKRFASLRGKADELMAYMTEIPCSWMTERVLDKMYNSIFRPFKTSEKARVLKRHYKQFGQNQRAGFEQSPAATARPTLKVMIRRPMFNKLVNREFPFNLCTAPEIAECLEKVVEDCIRVRGVSLMFLSEKADPIIADIASTYGSVDSVVVIDNLFTFRRELIETEAGVYPKLLKWSDDPEEIKRARRIVDALRETMPPSAEDDALAEVESLAKSVVEPDKGV